jgi:hypothetical protein
MSLASAERRSCNDDVWLETSPLDHGALLSIRERAGENRRFHHQ